MFNIKGNIDRFNIKGNIDRFLKHYKIVWKKDEGC